MLFVNQNITSSGGTFSAFAGFNTYLNYKVTSSGPVILLGNVVFNTPTTAGQQVFYTIRWDATLTLSTFSVVIEGNTINQSDVNQSGTFTCHYDGTVWTVQYWADGTDQPQVYYGVNTQVAPTSGTITLVAGVDKYYQRVIGPTTLAANLVITAATSGVKDGTRFYVEIGGGVTLGVNTFTVFGKTVSASDALNGNAMIIATFNATTNGWEAVYVKGSFSLSNLDNISALSVVANATNAVAQPTAVAASTNGRMFMRRSNALAWDFLGWDNFNNTNLFTPKTLGGVILSANVLTSNSTPVVLITELAAQGIPVLLTFMFGMSSGGTGYSSHQNIGIRYTGASDDLGSFNGALAIPGTDFYSHQIILEPPASGAVGWDNSIELYTKGGNPTGGTRNILWQAFFTTIPSP